MSGGAPLRIPGSVPSTRLGLGAIPSGPARRTELPEIYEAQPGDAMPSICIIGDSGTGKTYQLGLLIAHLRKMGKSTIVLSVESKHQGLTPHKPLILPIGAPVKLTDGSLRMPTWTERYHRLIEFRDQLRIGKFREHEGLPVGAILTDGMTEMGNVVKGYKFDNMPMAGASGQPNVLRAYGEIGADLLDLMAALKEAASDAGKAYGMNPIAVVATCVETLKDGKFQPLLPGNIAPDNFAQQFEVVLRLAVESAGPNTTEMQYVAHTMPGEVFLPQTGRWIAKSPEGFPAKIVNPNLGEIFEQVTKHYRGESLTVESNKGA
jgi:hypothetical protein